jgi:hypothetical protein
MHPCSDHFRLPLCLFLAIEGRLSLAACAESTDGWHRICPHGQFCTAVPPDLVEVPVQTIDSLVGVYESEVLRMNFDLGRYPVNLGEKAGQHVETRRVGGVDGEWIESGRQIAFQATNANGLHFTMILLFRARLTRNLQPGCLKVPISIRESLNKVVAGCCPNIVTRTIPGSRFARQPRIFLRKMAIPG